MSVQASIDISFARGQDPSEILNKLIGFGWEIGFGGKVMFLPENGFDEYEWVVWDLKRFDILDFLDETRKIGKAGITLVLSNDVGGEFLISRDLVSFSLSINRVLLVDRIPDFSWYISRILPALDGVEIFSIQCETIF
ncbi:MULTISPECIES: hypothetical protein [Pseudomonas]|uniref:hypothetical protein n=1 Tax=Pseudomonas nitroreducens TaxID=46680 RepID=UPI001E4367EB|nr:MULTISPECIES: hypothetical protein [Pseudomonas]MCE4073616.1 hypothetical protein [Pseudomonas nitritireducens]MCE4082805.1 hypothetical protein [Pseudomonas nitroreducens]